jgi:hypothetical protein
MSFSKLSSLIRPAAERFHPAWETIQAFNRRTSLCFYLWAAVLFLAGAAAWGMLFNGGQFPVDAHDWARVTAPRLTFLKNALEQGVLPFHIAERSALGGMTDRYMGIPDVILAPQVLLLRWMDIPSFVLADVWILYAVGFAGLLVFSRRQQLGALAFTLLFLLFNFNGHLVAHLAVGHLSWTGYFLYAWILVLVFDLLADRAGWRWVLWLSLTLFFMLLNGGYHQFVYCFFLFGLLALIRPRDMGWIVKGLLAAGLLCAVRILPVALNLASFHEHVNYMAGNFTLNSLLDSFVNIYGTNIINNNGLTDYIGLWEYSNYTGLLGAAFLAVFGGVQAYRSRRAANSPAVLLIPVIGLTVLSLDQVFLFLLKILPVPPLTGERVPGRMVNLAFLLLLAVAVVEFQRWARNREPKWPHALAFAGGVILLAHDLWQNLRAWQVARIVTKLEPVLFRPEIALVANHRDGKYYAAILAGLLLSLATLGVLVFLCRKKQKTG